MESDLLDKFAERLLKGSYAVGAFFFNIILAYQAYHWIRYGTWQPLPLSSAFFFFDFDLSYIYNPTDWHGLAKVCVWILNLPLSIFLPALIIFTCVVLKGLISANPE